MHLMKRILLIVSTCTIPALLAGAAPESAPTDGPVRQRLLQRFDKDKDGKLSPAEREEARRQWQSNRPAQAGKRGGDESLPADARVMRDVEYASVNGKSLRLDLYLPPKSAPAQPLPVVAWIHGGGWQAGSKAPCPIAFMCGEGYAVVSIEYRLTDVAIFPAQIHDCKAAIRWLRAHAKEYNLDPHRIGVAGASAGGHLVALLGTSGDVKEIEGDVGGNTQYSSRVQAVADFCGPAALAEGAALVPEDADERDRKAVAKLLGGPLNENRDKARQASPVTYITKDDPPFLIVHGDKDPLVPINQSEVLAAQLKKAGVPATFHVVKGGNHGVLLPETIKLAKEFFDQRLKGNTTASNNSSTRQSE